jgi:hypothetical protein
LVLGLCFISEGAIPFMAKDPLHVIPTCMLGGALTGAGGRRERPRDGLSGPGAPLPQ